MNIGLDLSGLGMVGSMKISIESAVGTRCVSVQRKTFQLGIRWLLGYIVYDEEGYTANFLNPTRARPQTFECCNTRCIRGRLHYLVKL